MRKEYPNLPLIEEKFKHIIYKKLKAAKEQSKDEVFHPSFDAEVFSETFPNTAGLLDASGVFSGQMFTAYYITVMYEENTGIYGVFQGNDFVYLVEDATDEFLQDVATHELATIEIAKDIY